ncbi:hypothetical protein [Aquimarina longa]|uniref:hypothetical protein n=1 Tax=Aquimarina longa TaxID=1080221 RepID=UPI00130E9780|nr:hypothetical protein [Aquimarina longa]
MTNYKYIIFTILTFLISGCSLYEPKYREPFDISIIPQEKEIKKMFYLIEDKTAAIVNT